MTLSRLNVNRIEGRARIAKNAGFSGIGFSRLVPCGSGEQLLDSVLSGDEIKSAYEGALALDSPSFEVASGDSLAGVLSGFQPSPETEIALSGCSAGFSGVMIASDGSVMPCRRIGIRIGNIRKTSPRHIRSTSKILQRLRERKNSKAGEENTSSGHPGAAAALYLCLLEISRQNRSLRR